MGDRTRQLKKNGDRASVRRMNILTLLSFEYYVFSQALGDNSQGLVNAVLFCICTKRVRRRLGRVLHCSRRCPCKRKKMKFAEFQASFQKRLDEELSSCSEIVNINTSETSPILT